MKTKKLIELERQRMAAIAEARDIFAEIEGEENGKKLAELEKRHDKAMRKIDQIRLDIDEEILKAAETEDRAQQERRRPLDNVRAGADDGGSDFQRVWGQRSGWANEKGEAVRVLTRAETLSDEEPEGIGLGDVVRAMATGARNDAERRALQEGTGSAGGYTVPTPLASWFIDRLRRASVAIRAGAMTVPMDSQTLSIARLETDPTIAWRAESGNIATGDPTFGRVVLTAKSLAGYIKVSRELLADTMNAGAMIEQALAKTMALEIDRAAIFGDGSGSSPTGVIATAGINTVSMGTNGASLAGFDPLLDALYELAVDNAAPPTAAILHPRTDIALAKQKNGDGANAVLPDKLKALPFLPTTAASITETQGTSTDCSSIVFGDFTQLFIGMREDINIRVLDQPFAATGEIMIVVHARADMQLAHAASFCRLLGIRP